jgi:hypothetical protein
MDTIFGLAGKEVLKACIYQSFAKRTNYAFS